MQAEGGRSDARKASLWHARLRAVLPLSRSDLAATGLLALAYGLTVGASLRWAWAPEAGAVVWPAAGIALAALIIRGPRLWPGVLAGELAGRVAIDGGGFLISDLILAVGAAVAAAVPAAAMVRAQVDQRLTDLRSILWLILAGGVGAGAISAASAALGGAEGVPVAAGLTAWGFGVMVGVLSVTPALLSWRPGRGQVFTPLSGLHLAIALAACGAIAFAVFLRTAEQTIRSWYIFPALVWASLGFSVRGASLAVLIVGAIAFVANVAGVGPFSTNIPEGGQTLVTQQYAAIVAVTFLILAAVADERRGREALRISAQRLREETEALEVLNMTGAAIAAELNLDAAVQRVTDAGVALSGAHFGAFFYNVLGDTGDSYMLYALSGAPRSAFERFGQPRSTEVFAPTFAGEGVVRVADITKDARYGRNPPHRGMPKGHLPVRSYLAAPVRSRSGEVLGGLFFGHPDADVFTERAERLIVGLAAQAAIAIDNARLYQAAQREIAERTRAEEHQRLLMNELNHRVKNTLATVQSMGAQTLRGGRSLAEAREAFVSRLMALSAAHNLLTAERWESADLEDLVRMAAAPFDEPPGARVSVEGPGVRLSASHAMGLAMALHELGVNAARYGALSAEGGSVGIAWRIDPGDRLTLVWQERDGPAVGQPLRRGFGSRLIQDALKRELRGEVRVEYLPDGVRCEIEFPLSRPAPPKDDFPDAEGFPESV